MKKTAILAAIFVCAGLLPAVAAQKGALDDNALGQIRAGLVVPVSSAIQTVGFGAAGISSSGPPAEIAIGILGEGSAAPLVLQETQSCTAARCTQVSTQIAVGIRIENLPAALRGF